MAASTRFKARNMKEEPRMTLVSKLFTLERFKVVGCGRGRHMRV